jgi:dolichol kinase
MAAELRRRAVHASGAGFPALFLFDLVDWPTLQYLLVASSVVVAVLEAVRLWVGLDWVVYETLTREYERDSVAGYALYMFSTTAVGWLFPPVAAVPGMLMLSLGDPVSGVLGSNEAGRAKRAGVVAAMFAVCLVVGSASLLALGAAAPPVTLAAAAVGAAGATVADGFTPVVAGYVVDDNLTIPPAACLGVWAVLSLAG